MKIRENKLNNRGMTLVELLVAMTILGIIVVPLLHAFVSSAAVNSKSRTSLRGTTIASDIIEGIKAYDVEEIAYQCNFPDKDFRVIDWSTVSGASVHEVRTAASISGDTISCTAVDVTQPLGVSNHAGVYSLDGGTTHEFIGQEDGRYYFTMEGVPFHNQKYDAFIALDAAPYRAGGTSALSANDVDIISVSRMNTNFDGFYVQSPQLDESMLTELNAPGHSIDKTATDRTITVELKKTPRVGKTDLTTVSCNYSYTGTDSAPLVLPYTVEKENIIFSNSETGKNLVNVYLFYYPLYNWKSDTIVIKNEDNLPVNFYVIKQCNPSGTATLLVDELNYQMHLNILETGGSAATAKTRLFTNLNTNLSNQTAVNQAVITLNGISTTLTDIKAANLTGSEKKDRLYDVTVYVYHEGAAASSFPKEDRIMKISGSKEE